LFFRARLDEMLERKLTQMLEPVVESLGYELVLLQYSPHRGGATLRLFIDSLGGITLEDCERVSREVSATLDVEDPIPQGYRLEVSSPGMDRPLVKPEHFERFVGRDVAIQLTAPKAGGRRRFSGRLLGYANRSVSVETAEGKVDFGLDEIERAHLVPHFEN
jgi:ribosome maturation factor RimP